MKIAICGSHGTGKSSFAKKLAEKIGGNYIHDIVTDEIVPQGFAINENTPPEVQILLMSRQWQLEQTTQESWVADKCLFDYWVYANAAFDDYIKKTLWMFVEKNGRYDVIFYLPIEFEMELNGIRSADLNFQKIMDGRYRKLLDDLRLKYIVLSSFIKESANKEEAIKKRVNLAMTYLNKIDL